MKVKMGKKVLPLLLSLLLLAGLVPTTVFAAEPATPTRTEQLTIEPTTEATDKLDSEGWEWKPSNDGGTLTLKDFYLKISETSDTSNYGIRFKGFSSDNNIIIKFEGNNIFETDVQKTVYMISGGSANLILQGASESTLKVSINNNEVSIRGAAFSGNSLAVESGTIESNIDLCLVDRGVTISGGKVTVEAKDVPSSDGIYTVWGPVNISGGDVYLHAARDGIFVAGNNAKAGDPLSVNITGGNVTVIADNPGEGEWGYGIYAPNFLIETEGKVNVYGSDIAIFSTASTNGETRTISILKVGMGSRFENSPDSPYNIVHVNGAGGGTSTATTTINPADYTAVDAAENRANALNPDVYSNFSVVTAALNAVDKTKNLLEQDEVNAMAQAINNAIAALQYKDADFTDLQAAIDRANNLNKDNYKDFSKVEAAVDAAMQAIEEGRDITKQDEVNAMAKAIEDTIAALQYKDADYSNVQAAIDKANALNQDDYKDFSKVETAIRAVIEGKNITEQEEVDAMAKAIENAIASLEKKSADQTEMLSDPDVPVTGDPDNPVLWTVLVLLSAGILTVASAFSFRYKKAK